MDGGDWWATYSPRGRKESDTTEQLHFHFPDLAQVSRGLHRGPWHCRERQGQEKEETAWGIEFLNKSSSLNSLCLLLPLLGTGVLKLTYLFFHSESLGQSSEDYEIFSE